MDEFPLHWEELLEVVLEWSFAPLAIAVLLLVTVGAGHWTTRWKRSAWVLGLALFGFCVYFGVGRHEWGEVLFNGQLL
jgi:hypothetical protein